MTNTFYPKTNSQSPVEEQLVEIRGMALDQLAQMKCDKRNDPLIFWKPVDYDPRFPNTDVTRYVSSVIFRNLCIKYDIASTCS